MDTPQNGNLHLLLRQILTQTNAVDEELKAHVRTVQGALNSLSLLDIRARQIESELNQIVILVRDGKERTPSLQERINKLQAQVDENARLLRQYEQKGQSWNTRFWQIFISILTVIISVILTQLIRF